MTFAEALIHLDTGRPIGRASKTVADNICYNKEGLLVRADGMPIKLYDEDLNANDWEGFYWSWEIVE